MTASSPGSSPFPLWRKNKRPFSLLPPPWKWILRRLLNTRVIRSFYVRAVAKKKKKKKREIRLCDMYWSYLLAIQFYEYQFSRTATITSQTSTSEVGRPVMQWTYCIRRHAISRFWAPSWTGWLVHLA